MPARVLDEVAADQRAEDGADERGHDGVIDGVDEPVFFIDFQQRQARHRHDDGAAHALNDAGADEHWQAGGERAEERAEHEDDERDDEGFARAEAVGEVAAGGDEQGDGEGVGDDGGLHIERRDVQVGGDGGQGGVQDGRIQHLHEDGDGHKQRKPARGRGGGVHVWVWQKRTVIIVFSVFLAMAMRARWRFSVVFYMAGAGAVFPFCAFGKCSKIAPVCDLFIFLWLSQASRNFGFFYAKTDNDRDCR